MGQGFYIIERHKADHSQNDNAEVQVVNVDTVDKNTPDGNDFLDTIEAAEVDEKAGEYEGE